MCVSTKTHENTMETIFTNKLKLIGTGAFGKVFRLSHRRIVKVFSSYNSEEYVNRIIKDEIRGSKFKGSLPVLKVVNVVINGRKTKGLVKRYLQYPITPRELDDLIRKKKITALWDDRPVNFRKDSKGNIYRIDTMTSWFKEW